MTGVAPIRRWWIMGVLGTAELMATLDISIVDIALPQRRTTSCLFVNALFAGVAFVGGSALLPGGSSGQRPHPDIVGAVTAAGLFCVVFGLANAEDHEWTAPLVVPFLAAGVAPTTGLTPPTRRHERASPEAKKTGRPVVAGPVRHGGLGSRAAAPPRVTDLCERGSDADEHDEGDSTARVRWSRGAALRRGADSRAETG
jgi:hypothetical protein